MRQALSLLFLAVAVAVLLCVPARAGEDVLALWDKAGDPPLPAAKPVVLDPDRAALLVLDIEEGTCTAERRPRCLDTVPRIAALAQAFRAAGAAVVYSLTRRGTPDTVLPPVKARPGEPFVQSGVDKFFQTNLEDILKGRLIDTVVVTGTAAHGAVLHTATGAAQRGMSIVLPADGLSAETPFIEKAVVWLLLEGPATRGKVALTRCADISFKAAGK